MIFLCEKIISGELIVQKSDANNSHCPDNALFVYNNFIIDI